MQIMHWFFVFQIISLFISHSVYAVQSCDEVMQGPRFNPAKFLLKKRQQAALLARHGFHSPGMTPSRGGGVRTYEDGLVNALPGFRPSSPDEFEYILNLLDPPPLLGKYKGQLIQAEATSRGTMYFITRQDGGRLPVEQSVFDGFARVRSSIVENIRLGKIEASFDVDLFLKNWFDAAMARALGSQGIGQIDFSILVLYGDFGSDRTIIEKTGNFSEKTKKLVNVITEAVAIDRPRADVEIEVAESLIGKEKLSRIYFDFAERTLAYWEEPTRMDYTAAKTGIKFELDKKKIQLALRVNAYLLEQLKSTEHVDHQHILKSHLADIVSGRTTTPLITFQRAVVAAQILSERPDRDSLYRLQWNEPPTPEAYKMKEALMDRGYSDLEARKAIGFFWSCLSFYFYRIR